jgi:hypothetical protein
MIKTEMATYRAGLLPSYTLEDAIAHLQLELSDS